MNTYNYYYSMKFAGEELRFHGYFKTSWSDLETVKDKARESISEKMKVWGFTGDDIEYFEIYTYKNYDEKQIFEWRK